ncbi:MAG: 6-carboxytetrahydropterin synthase QueD [Oscillospiraceae bacterium]
MFVLKTEAEFDSAHFLFGYEGKCRNIHGHRWKIAAEISADSLENEGQTRGMIVDFGDFKGALKEIADSFDHALIYEKGSLKASTVAALCDESFRLIEVDFRPTAENFAKHFTELLQSKGYNVRKTAVYETPTNCAEYYPCGKEGN